MRFHFSEDNGHPLIKYLFHICIRTNITKRFSSGNFSPIYSTGYFMQVITIGFGFSLVTVEPLYPVASLREYSLSVLFYMFLTQKNKNLVLLPCLNCGIHFHGIISWQMISNTLSLNVMKEEEDVSSVQLLTCIFLTCLSLLCVRHYHVRSFL